MARLTEIPPATLTTLIVGRLIIAAIFAVGSVYACFYGTGGAAFWLFIAAVIALPAFRSRDPDGEC